MPSAYRVGPSPTRLGGGDYVDETVRRLRPLARRRFKTCRPFLVAMRTRNPCVLLRRRRFGWNVRLPFMIQLPRQPANECGENQNFSEPRPRVSKQSCRRSRRVWAFVSVVTRVLESPSFYDGDTTPLGAPPEVFHNCGKKCGKARVFALRRSRNAEVKRVSTGRRRKMP
jgi:hypothetical protein